MIYNFLMWLHLGRYKGIDTKEDLEKVKQHFLN